MRPFSEDRFGEHVVVELRPGGASRDGGEQRGVPQSRCGAPDREPDCRAVPQ